MDKRTGIRELFFIKIKHLRASCYPWNIHYMTLLSPARGLPGGGGQGLSNAGLKVLVIEKNRLPRYKMCSGIIFKKSQDLTEKHFGKIPDTAYVKPRLLSGVRLWSDPKRFADWPFNKNGDGAPISGVPNTITG